jgi:AcrR family transcriptional regulator
LTLTTKDTALRKATAELVAEKGPTGFSLREVARRAGVSHAAPAHHFGDAQGLLTSLAKDVADSTGTATAPLDDLVESFTDVLIDGFRVR